MLVDPNPHNFAHTTLIVGRVVARTTCRSELGVVCCAGGARHHAFRFAVCHLWCFLFAVGRPSMQTFSSEPFACGYTLNSTNQSFGASGGDRGSDHRQYGHGMSVEQFLSRKNAGGQPTWLTITRGASGTGNGSGKLRRRYGEYRHLFSICETDNRWTQFLNLRSGRDWADLGGCGAPCCGRLRLGGDANSGSALGTRWNRSARGQRPLLTEFGHSISCKREHPRHGRTRCARWSADQRAGNTQSSGAYIYYIPARKIIHHGPL